MRAAWYERRGPAHEVLIVAEMPDPRPGPGEVRIAVAVSGLSPGDVKKRGGGPDAPMRYPRVVPHSDGGGVIDAVGPGVSDERIGQRVWCYGAQSYRPFGTAAEYVVVPDALAVALPDAHDEQRVLDLSEQGACLGIAGITGLRAVFADGPVTGLVVLVHGATGGVGSIATQMAARDGAHVIAVVRSQDQLGRALGLGAHAAFLEDQPDLAERIKAEAPDGVHRIAEVDLAAHIELDASVIAVGGVIASFASSQEQPRIPYWTLGFADATLRLLGSDDFPATVKARAAAELTAALGEGRLRSAIADRVPLEDIATAHQMVEDGAAGRVLVIITAPSPRSLPEAPSGGGVAPA